MTDYEVFSVLAPVAAFACFAFAGYMVSVVVQMWRESAPRGHRRRR